MHSRRTAPSLAFATVVALAFAVPSCTSVEKVIVAEPDVPFTLPIGKTATVPGSPNRIAFTRVTEDSRCPTNVVCVWEGEAKIEVAISRNGAPANTAILTLRPPTNEAQLGDLVVRFVGLAPAPVSPEPAPRKYVAELVIRKR